MAAAASAASTASAAASSASTLSALVRRLLVESGNKPVRLNSLWDAVRAQAPAATTKTHFKRRIIGQMFVRDEVRGWRRKLAGAGSRGRGPRRAARRAILNHFYSHPRATPRKRPQLVKLRVADELKAGKGAAAASLSASSLVYAVRLKGSAKVNGALQRQGLDVDVRTLASRKAAAERGAAAAAAAAPAPAAAAAAAAAPAVKEPPLQ